MKGDETLERIIEAKKTHPEFTITCDRCGSRIVIVDSDVGFSDTSGSWGSVNLECLDCGASIPIWQA